MTPATLDDIYIIRFCVNAQNLNEEQIIVSWKLIESTADKILGDYNNKSQIIATYSRIPRCIQSVFNPLLFLTIKRFVTKYLRQKIK